MASTHSCSWPTTSVCMQPALCFLSAVWLPSLSAGAMPTSPHKHSPAPPWLSPGAPSQFLFKSLDKILNSPHMGPTTPEEVPAAMASEYAPHPECVAMSSTCWVPWAGEYSALGSLAFLSYTSLY